jgi:hypothetical protein
VLSMKHTRRASLARTLAVVDMILMSTSNLELEHTFAEKNQLLLRALRASPVDPD